MPVNGDDGKWRTSEYKITKLDLGHLRWLVAQCDGMHDSSIVEVQAFKSHSPMDWDESYIMVRGQAPA